MKAKTIAALLALFVNAPWPSRAADIVGSVLDNNKQELSGVTVSAYRDSQLVDQFRATDNSGEYKLAVGQGQIDVIEFRKPGFHLGLIKDLQDQHGDQENTIIKLIYPNPEGSSRFAVRISLLLNYEMFFYYRTNPIERDPRLTKMATTELRENYRPLVDRLRRPEEHWTPAQRRIYAAAYRRVASLYALE